jgi:hypothetical protein
MDFSGATTLMGTFKTFAIYAGRNHLLRQPDLRGHSDDERPLSRRDSGSLRSSVRCRRAGLRRWLDWISHRPADPVMARIRRGEPLPINQAMNRPQAKLGLDLSTWMVVVFVTVAVFLVGFRLVAILSFPTLACGAWLVVRRHPEMFQLWGLSLKQKSYYDPRKH